MIYYGKTEFGQISRSFGSNNGAILLKRLKNLTRIGFPSLRSVKPDRLLDRKILTRAYSWHIISDHTHANCLAAICCYLMNLITNSPYKDYWQ